MIKLKCDYSSGAVAVPTDVIDKHLKLAPAASFKVLLFLLRNPESVEDAEQISKSTGLSVGDVKNCLSYWEGYSLIEKTDEKVDSNKIIETSANAKIATKEENKPQNEQPKVVRSLPVKKPTQREIALRLTKEPELSVLYKEAQNILGTFGYDTEALILMIYDYYGFPFEVILTLLQYQMQINKISSSAIKSRAEDWAKRGIDTLDLVEGELLTLEKIDKIFNDIKGEAGFKGDKPTPREAKYIREWVETLESSTDLILFALKESNKTLSDANKLLKKWANTGVKTIAEAEERKRKSLPKEIKKSYDTNKVGKNSVLDWMQKYADEEEN